MAPPIQPRDLRGRPLDAKGRPLDAHGRPLDNFDRPIHSRIAEPTRDVSYGGYANIVIAFPSLGDWTAMYDPRGNRGDQVNLATYEDFRRRHEKQMTGALDAMSQTAAGRALLGEARSLAPHTVTILPMDFVSSQKRWIKYHNNAIQSADIVDARVIGMYAGTRANKTNRVASGAGTDSEIYYSPERLKSSGPGKQPDEVLFHEMVHAIRAMRGVSMSGFKMGNGYDNAEEFAAVVVTNVYLSEKKQTAFRANHGRGILSDTRGFLDSRDVPAPGARALLNGMRQRQPAFFAAIAGIGAGAAAFNPLRDFAEEARKATAAHDAKMRAFDAAQRRGGK